MEWAAKLWNKNKWLFFLAIPLVLLFVFKDVIMALLASNIHKTVKDAEKKDDELKDEVNKMNKVADILKAEADKIGKDIEDSANKDIPSDWHKNE